MFSNDLRISYLSVSSTHGSRVTRQFHGSVVTDFHGRWLASELHFHDPRFPSDSPVPLAVSFPPLRRLPASQSWASVLLAVPIDGSRPIRANDNRISFCFASRVCFLAPSAQIFR